MKTSKSLKLAIFLIVVGLGVNITAWGQQPYSLSNTPGSLLLDRNGVPLDNQTPTTAGNGQGQLIQLGYFSTATIGNLFGNGTFLPLAQFKSGDSDTGVVDVPNGRIILTTQFNTSNQATNFAGGATQLIYAALSAYPTAGTPLSIRWFDTTTTSGFYNSVSATNWLWVTPTNTPATALSFNFGDGSATGLSYQDNAHPLKASISNVPEPSTYALLGTGLLTAFTLVRRRKTA